MRDLAVIIVSYNARADLERCLASLAVAPPTTPHQVVVVDNASSDGSPSAVTSTYPDVRLIALDCNVGFGRANNVGIRATGSEYVLLLNNDTVVPAGAIDLLVAELDAHPEVAIIGPRLVDASGRPEISFGRMIGPLNEARQKLLGTLYQRGFAPAVRHVEGRIRVSHDPDWVSGACLLARRADLDAVGLFDERFFLYTEDVDLCASVRALGRKVRFTPHVQVTHLRGQSRHCDQSAASRAYLQSRLAFYRKHHPRWVAVLRWYLRMTGRGGRD